MIKEEFLKNLCKKNGVGKYGIPASSEKFDLTKIRYLRISDIDDYGNLLDLDKRSVSSNDIHKYILEENDLVVARTGNSTGRTYFHERKNGKLAFAGFLIKYSLDSKKINPKYLKYYTLSKKYKQWVNNLSVGSTRGNINAQTFANCPITFPERKQQDLMVKILSSIDDKIELNNKINDNLEQIAKALYNYWFVQFDFPDNHGNPYKSQGGKMVWNEQIKSDIPKGWKIGKLGDVLILEYGKPLKKEDRTGTGFPVLGSNGIVGYHDLFLVKGPGIVVGRKGSAGEIVRVGQNFFPIDTTYYVIDKLNLISVDYHFQLLKCINLKSIESSSAVPGLNRNVAQSLMIIKPPDQLIRLYTEYIYKLYRKVDLNNQQNQELKSLRDWLLPMLMNGQIKI